MGYPARPITDCSQVPHLGTSSATQRAPRPIERTVSQRGVSSHQTIAAGASKAVGATFSLHYALELDASGAHINVTKAPSIDCNSTASCVWHDSTPDLSTVAGRALVR